MPDAEVGAGAAAEAAAEVSADDYVRAIRSADELITIAEARLHGAVIAARADGVSWQVIGDALGTSRQAAFKRFGAVPNPTSETGEHLMSQPVVNLVERTENVFRSLNKGDFGAVKSLMTFTCARALTKKRVMDVWTGVIASSGQFESCSKTVVQTLDGRTVAEQLWNQYLGAGVVGQTQLNHEAGEWMGRVAYSSSGKITGILIVSPGSTNLPF
ncbi:hypothetical protein B0I08_107102 [Glaciihabitans tibetensis]|uniref:Uncharacterized protein n=1 Tax=Glaciihabitans tibetensis TaxID=1266600 RepID=A0A2T0VAY8_9MICO|nr:hypothetical protein [Glaciihabitans tibetensis]PRY67207.1 hypothetical protein B0I08_107102 [Glaciihabitans tibetensis]